MDFFDVYARKNVVIDRASGSFVWDDRGQKYLDMYGGHAVISIGHGHPHWKKRIEDQLNKVAFYSNSVLIPLQDELADKLGRLSEKEGYSLFLVNSGAEANENAIKLASFQTGRKKVISFSGAFHGRTSLAVAATDNPAIVAPVNQTENRVLLPFNDEAKLREAMAKMGHDVAAIIVEAIQGVGGIRVADDSFLQLIRQLCNQYGAIYIADEVQCGYGRTGKFFATDYTGIKADLYTMAKGIGNGFPVAAVAISPAFKPHKSMLGTTFGGNHLACAAAIAVLEIMKEEDLMTNALEVGGFLLHELKNIAELGNVRGRGLMIGFDVPENLAGLRDNLLWHEHVFTGVAKPNVIRLLPSLGLSMDEARLFVQKLKKEISHLKNKSVETFSVGS